MGVRFLHGPPTALSPAQFRYAGWAAQPVCTGVEHENLLPPPEFERLNGLARRESLHQLRCPATPPLPQFLENIYRYYDAEQNEYNYLKNAGQ